MSKSVFLIIVVILTLCSPTIIAQPEKETAPIDKARLATRVQQEFLHAWTGYKQYAWGHDDLKPISRSFHDWHATPLYMTAVDALDVLLLMGLNTEADSTREFIAANLRFDYDIEVKNFEITIRILGGLLSSYQMTGDKRLLALADDLGARLLPVFNSPTGMPYMYVNLKTGTVRGAVTNPAEIGTLLVEFGTLSKLTSKPVYFDKAKNAVVALYARRSPIGLVGTWINIESGIWADSTCHISGAIDSYFEYLLKCARLFDDHDCDTMFQKSLAAINTYLADTVNGSLWYGSADMFTGKRNGTSYGALDAFFPGILALAGDIDRARRLQESSYKMWNTFGIEPEQIDYTTMQTTYPGYPLRPEIIESAYYLYSFTKDPYYLQMGESILDSLVRYCRTDVGYASLKDVRTKEKKDEMESFFLAETLKYLYLLFSPEDKIDLSNVTFNTEAHPIQKTW